MKRNQTVKGKDYPLSVNSKLASLDFTRATTWASQIYTPLKLHEKRLVGRPLFQELSQLLVKVYNSDQIHGLGTKKLFAGDVAMLTKWHLSIYSKWHLRLGVNPNLTITPHTGKAKITIAKFNLSAAHFIDRARQMAMRFYVYLLDEDKELIQVEITDDLLVDFDVAHNEIEAHFDFSPITNGVLLLVGIAQLHLAATDHQHVFASYDRRYYQASLIQAQAVKDGQLFQYNKQITEPEQRINITKVAWQPK